MKTARFDVEIHLGYSSRSRVYFARNYLMNYRQNAKMIQPAT